MKNKKIITTKIVLTLMCFILDITNVRSQEKLHESLYQDIDFQQDYLKLSKIDKVEKIYIEQCNSMKTGIQFNVKDMSFQRKNKRPHKTRYNCKPITHDQLNSCLELKQSSIIENNLDQSIFNSVSASYIVPVLGLLALRDSKHMAIFSEINKIFNEYSKENDLKIIIGISKFNPQKLRVNASNSGKTFSVSKLVESYVNPGKIDWKYSSENKFVSTFKALLLNPIVGENGEFMSIDLSCTNNSPQNVSLMN